MAEIRFIDELQFYLGGFTFLENLWGVFNKIYKVSYLTQWSIPYCRVSFSLFLSLIPKPINLWYSLFHYRTSLIKTSQSVFTCLRINSAQTDFVYIFTKQINWWIVIMQLTFLSYVSSNFRQGDTLDYLGIPGLHLAGSQGVVVIAICQVLLMVMLLSLSPLSCELLTLFISCDICLPVFQFVWAHMMLVMMWCSTSGY